MQHEVDELVEVNRLIAISVNLVEELFNVLLSRLLVDTCLFEVHLKQVFDFLTLQHTIAILIEGVKCDAHLFDTLTTDRFRMLIDLHHHFVLADQVLHVVFAIVHISPNY